MKKMKFGIENSIVMKGRFRQLVQQVDFDDVDVSRMLKENPCHIYMVCSRPKITFVRDEISFKNEKFQIAFLLQGPENHQIKRFEFENEHGMASYELSPANNRLKVFDQNGQILTEGKSSLIYSFCQPDYDPILDLNVLYVGQAFGSNGERLASDRLTSHSTLQKIYADIIDNNPNDEVWLILWQFEPYIISMIGGSTLNATHGLDESIKNYINITDSSSIPIDQKITSTEAALIKYFSPQYNTEYKTTFPSSSHSSYEVCYRLEFNNVCFEIDTLSIRTRLYSVMVDPCFFHSKNYFLHSEIDRKNMFNIEDMRS